MSGSRAPTGRGRLSDTKPAPEPTQSPYVRLEFDSASAYARRPPSRLNLTLPPADSTQGTASAYAGMPPTHSESISSPAAPPISARMARWSASPLTVAEPPSPPTSRHDQQATNTSDHHSFQQPMDATTDSQGYPAPDSNRQTPSDPTPTTPPDHLVATLQNHAPQSHATAGLHPSTTTSASSDPIDFSSLPVILDPIIAQALLDPRFSKPELARWLHFYYFDFRIDGSKPDTITLKFTCCKSADSLTCPYPSNDQLASRKRLLEVVSDDKALQCCSKCFKVQARNPLFQTHKSRRPKMDHAAANKQKSSAARAQRKADNSEADVVRERNVYQAKAQALGAYKANVENEKSGWEQERQRILAVMCAEDWSETHREYEKLLQQRRAEAQSELPKPGKTDLTEALSAVTHDAVPGQRNPRGAVRQIKERAAGLKRKKAEAEAEDEAEEDEDGEEQGEETANDKRRRSG